MSKPEPADVKKDRAKVCTSRVGFQNTWIAFGASLPVAFYWRECMNEPTDAIEAELKALEPQLAKEETALAAKVAKDFEEFDKAKSKPSK